MILGAILIMAFYNQVIRFLAHPYNELCEDRGAELCAQALEDGQVQFLNLDPVAGLSTRLSVAMYGGMLIAIPIIVWQIWKFVVPALKSNEKKYAVPFMASSVGLFALGGFLAYLTLGKALEFLISWAGEDVNSNFTISSYIRLVMLMVAAFGIGFQFPVLLVSFQFVGDPHAATAARGVALRDRRHRRPRRRDHAIRRPDLAGRARAPDAAALLRRRRHRPARPASPRSGSRARARRLIPVG